MSACGTCSDDAPPAAPDLSRGDGRPDVGRVRGPRAGAGPPGRTRRARGAAAVGRTGGAGRPARGPHRDPARPAARAWRPFARPSCISWGWGVTSTSRCPPSRTATACGWRSTWCRSATCGGSCSPAISACPSARCASPSSTASGPPRRTPARPTSPGRWRSCWPTTASSARRWTAREREAAAADGDLVFHVASGARALVRTVSYRADDPADARDIQARVPLERRVVLRSRGAAPPPRRGRRAVAGAALLRGQGRRRGRGVARRRRRRRDHHVRARPAGHGGGPRQRPHGQAARRVRAGGARRLGRRGLPRGLGGAHRGVPARAGIPGRRRVVRPAGRRRPAADRVHGEVRAALPRGGRAVRGRDRGEGRRPRAADEPRRGPAVRADATRGRRANAARRVPAARVRRRVVPAGRRARAGGADVTRGPRRRDPARRRRAADHRHVAGDGGQQRAAADRPRGRAGDASRRPAVRAGCRDRPRSHPHQVPQPGIPARAHRRLRERVGRPHRRAGPVRDRRGAPGLRGPHSRGGQRSRRRGDDQARAAARAREAAGPRRHRGEPAQAGRPRRVPPRHDLGTAARGRRPPRRPRDGGGVAGHDARLRRRRGIPGRRNRRIRAARVLRNRPPEPLGQEQVDQPVQPRQPPPPFLHGRGADGRGNRVDLDHRRIPRRWRVPRTEVRQHVSGPAGGRGVRAGKPHELQLPLRNRAREPLPPLRRPGGACRGNTRSSATTSSRTASTPSTSP